MMRIGQVISKNCQGVSRRELLQVGGLGILGITLADELRAAEARTADSQVTNRSSETACIFIFLEGGPSQLETFDPKPNAINDVRGPYGTIATNVPGIQICELLPMMAERMDRYAVIRSLTGFTGAHTARPALTGAGIPGGTVVGMSDAKAAYPANDPVSPAELAATLYRVLGINTNTDPRVRPFIGNASPVAALV